MSGNEGTVPKGWLLALGIILVIIGVLAIGLPFVAALAIELLIGWILVIGGVVRGVHVFWSRDMGRQFLRFLGALLYLVAGILMLVFPLQGVFTLTLLLAILFIIGGFFEVITSLCIRPMLNWGWLLFNGILALIIGALIWAGWPSSAAWAIGLLVGINIIFKGWTMILVASAMREQNFPGSIFV